MPLLAHDRIQMIHNASLEMLATVGVKVDHPEVFRRLRAAGRTGMPTP